MAQLGLVRPIQMPQQSSSECSVGGVKGISCLERTRIYKCLTPHSHTHDVHQDDSMEEEGDDHEDCPVVHHVSLHAQVPVVDLGDVSDGHREESLRDGKVRLVHVEMAEGVGQEVEEDSVADQGKHEQLPVELKHQLRT